MAELSAQELSKLAASGKPGALPQNLRQGGSSNGATQEQQEQQEELKRQMLSGILSPEARERLSRISLVKPERARGVQEMLLKMFQGGQLRGKVSEEQLVDVLDQIEKVEGGGGKGREEKGKITFSRRKDILDDDD
ncbi:hypothetical protein BT69DRAFT_1278177, partial [Atractiella rhizophila]